MNNAKDIRKLLLYVDKIKFIKTERFSPVIYDNDMPNKDDYDAYVLWWNEQRRRCLEGYVVNKATNKGDNITITGRHYFYLNFCSIYGLKKGTKIKGEIAPRFTSLDFKKAYRMELMVAEDKDNLELKARQKGFSEFIAGAGLCYNFTFVPASVNVIVAGVDDDSEALFLKTERMLDGLVETEFYKERSPDKSDFKKASYKETIIDDEGRKRVQVKGFKSTIYSLTARNNPEAVSRLTPYWVIMEEGGKWQRDILLAAKGFIDPSLEAEGIKTGYEYIIATGGDMERGVADVEEMFYNPAEYNLLEFKNVYEEGESNTASFTPGWEFEKVDKDGNTLKKESVEKLQEERNQKKGKKLLELQAKKPFNPSEAFQVISGSFFSPGLRDALSRRRAYIKSHREEDIGVYGHLVENDPSDWGKGMKFHPGADRFGKEDIFIVERPNVDVDGKVPDNLYFGATDSYDVNESQTSESKGSCGILKGFLNAKNTYNMWVARITVRPEGDGTLFGGAEKFYEKTIKLMIYFNALNLLEWSKILLASFYERKGFEHLLVEKPAFLTSTWIKDSKASNRYGIDPSTKIHWLMLLEEFLVKDDYANVDKMFDCEQIEALAKYRLQKGYNCDITIHTSLNVVCLEEFKETMMNRELIEEAEIDVFDIGYQKMGEDIIHI